MRCLTLLTLFVLAMLAVGSSQAGKVVINGACVDCNRPDAATTTTRRPTTAHAGRGRGRPTTAKPKKKSGKTSDEDEDDLSDFSLSQDAHGGQHISAGRRHKRQYQQIQIDPVQGIGGRSRHVTTLDSRGYPGVLVHNDDCVGCNIRG